MKRYTCKQCRNKGESGTQVRDGVYSFCSKSCRLEFQREKVRKQKEKVKERKVKARKKKQSSVSYLTKTADKLWSEAVKIEYNYECQYCGKKEYLNSHHLFTRSRRATRWDIDNGMCLCSGCHTLSSNFSAHQTPLEFFEWLEGIRGIEWIRKLSKRSQSICKVDSELLEGHIKALQEYIKQNKSLD